MKRPFKKGVRVLCIDAKEAGIPISEGETYTVEWCGDPADMTVVDAADRASIPAVRLAEVEGLFMATRFEMAPA